MFWPIKKKKTKEKKNRTPSFENLGYNIYLGKKRNTKIQEQKKKKKRKEKERKGKGWWREFDVIALPRCPT